MGILSLFGKADTVYFPGCTCYFRYKENFELYKKIFSKLGIKFKEVSKKVCCGLPSLGAGHESVARKLARRNFEIFKEEDIKSIITTSPEAYKMFSQNYPDLLPDWNLEVKNIWQIILDKIESKPRMIRESAMEQITYHDSCYLGRYSGIYETPRKILEAIGYEIKEMNNSKEKSICCGSCGGLKISNPELADKIARERILQAKRIGVRKMIVASLENYELLKKNSKDTGVKILEFSEILARALGIKKPEDINDEKNKEESEEEKIVNEAKANIKLNEELNEEEISYGYEKV